MRLIHLVHTPEQPHTRLKVSFCFNPRPYTRGDFREAAIAILAEVSIHAPTRGATIFFIK